MTKDLKLGWHIGYWGRSMPVGVPDTLKMIEALGYDSVFTAESWGSDAISPLAWWGAGTTKLRLATNIVQISARTPAMPDLPNIGETVPGFALDSWFGVMGPARLPPDIVGRLNAVIVKSLSSADMKERLSGQGAEPVGGTPEQFAAHVKTEIAKWARVIKAARIRLE